MKDQWGAQVTGKENMSINIPILLAWHLCFALSACQPEESRIALGSYWTPCSKSTFSTWKFLKRGCVLIQQWLFKPTFEVALALTNHTLLYPARSTEKENTWCAPHLVYWHFMTVLHAHLHTSVNWYILCSRDTTSQCTTSFPIMPAYPDCPRPPEGNVHLNHAKLPPNWTWPCLQSSDSS